MQTRKPSSPKSDLAAKSCKACEGEVAPLAPAHIKKLLPQVPGWKVTKGQLTREFRFENYYQTLAFVNATAWISHAENHHPDLQVGYNRCQISYSTHSVGGLTENDFICAAKVGQLINQ